MELIKVIEDWNAENLIPDGKRYRSKDGKYLSSPTALLRALDPVGQKAMEAIPPFILEKCRVIGNDFEEAIHMYELGEATPQEIADQLFGSAKLMFLSFVNERKKRPELEFVAHDVLVGTDTYFGKIDFLYKENGKPIIVEVKTAKEKPRLSHFVQLSLYAEAMKNYGLIFKYRDYTTELWLGQRGTGMFETYANPGNTNIFGMKIRAIRVATYIQEAQEVLKEEQ